MGTVAPWFWVELKGLVPKGSDVMQSSMVCVVIGLRRRRQAVTDKIEDLVDEANVLQVTALGHRSSLFAADPAVKSAASANPGIFDCSISASH